ncbi:MAG: 16S rRNA (adenine(1518)-N(6)/adenine(1519)-N(6))-dimethyltransferase RsmA [Bacteroidales bacterium]
MIPVRAKKHLGQHFLTDDNIARKIVASLQRNKNVMEIGPGTGILTKHLLQIPGINLKVIEIDKESVEYLSNQYPDLKNKIIIGDCLQIDMNGLFDGCFSVIGNFPYNISSQILFKVLEYKNLINEVVGMFQKEVAVRIASKPGNKNYGILSVLLQAFYNIEYLFTVNETVFIPHPKVKSAVIRLVRNDSKTLDCDEKLFFSIVKTAFNQRRKTLRNALSSFKFSEDDVVKILLTKRAEQQSVQEFVLLTKNVNC